MVGYHSSRFGDGHVVPSLNLLGSSDAFTCSGRATSGMNARHLFEFGFLSVLFGRGILAGVTGLALDANTGD